MDFKSKYCNTAEMDKDENKDKIVLTDGEYAVLELLNDIAFRISKIKLG